MIMKQSSHTIHDTYQVEFASRLQGISEFKLFGDAYYAWHGKQAPEKLLAPFFSRYLMEGIVPYWVRNHVRKSLNDPGLQQRLHKQRRVATWGYVVPIAVEFAVLMYFLL